MRRWMAVFGDRPWLIGIVLALVAIACNDGGGAASGRSDY